MADEEVARLESTRPLRILEEARRPASRSRQGSPPWLGRALHVAALASLPAAAIAMGFPVCPFAIVTHHPCPGCGLTRATLALLHGRLAEALRFHPLVIVLAPLVGIACVATAYAYITRRTRSFEEALGSPWATRVAALLLALVLGVWVARFFGAFGGPVSVG